MIELVGRTRRSRTGSDGFTLVELLVVIVILGILSAVVVFAVRGAGDKGKGAAVATDERTLRTAEEIYCAKYGNYATPAQLLDDKLIAAPPTIHDVNVSGGGPCTANAAMAAAASKFVLSCKEPDCGVTAPVPGGHQPVLPGVCGQVNGWCVDATPGGTPQWDETLQSMVQLPNGKVFAVYQDADTTCNAFGVCTFIGKSGIFDPAATQPNQRWTPGPTLPGTTTGSTNYALFSMLVIEGTFEQCDVRCGQVLADLVGWRLYNPAENTWTLTPPSLQKGRSARAVQLTGSECGDRCGQVLVVAATNFGGRSAFYNPKTNAWTPGPDIDGIDNIPVLALLQDGRVLVVSANVAKLIDPRKMLPGMVSDAARPTGPYLGDRMIPARLPDGRILFTDTIAEIYSPVPGGSGSWASAAKCGGATDCQVVAQLSDGRVLARASDNYLRNEGGPFATFLFYPNDGHWHPTGTPNTLAPDGIGVLVAERSGCGDSCNKVLTVGRRFDLAVPSAELYTPPPP